MGQDPLLNIADEDIILGIKPTLESISYAGKDLKTLGLTYGLVYKNEIYQDIINYIHSDMARHVQDCFVASINLQRSLQNYIFVCRGNILEKESTIDEGNADAYIKGTKYHSDIFNVDYYNDVIVPTETKSTTDQNTAKVQVDDPTNVIQHDGTEVRLITKVVDYEFYRYLYSGGDPLPLKITKETHLYLPFFIDRKRFAILGFLDVEDNITVMIANKRKMTDMTNNPDYVLMIDEMSNGYLKRTISDVDFYRQTTVERFRYEDAITAK